METTLLPDPRRLRLERLVPADGRLTLEMTSVQASACCPRCGHPSERVHSRYQRTVADLPWRGIAVRLKITARRLFCDNGRCERRIFAEPLPQLVARYARRTDRLADALLLIAHALGGEAGARLARELGLTVSPDTLLRRVCRAAPPAPGASPRVLGVDDFAFARGRRYGTILVDLERRRPVDLLPDRQADTLAAWLKAHPGVEVVSRDRASAYADGARAGAPEAVQVADRWHLLKNLGDALERLLTREYPSVRQAARDAPLRADGPPRESAQAGTAPLTEAASPAAAVTERAPPRAEQDRQARRGRRQARYDQVMALQGQGVSARAIAASLGLSRNTVRRLIRAPAFPESVPRPRRPAGTDAFDRYLRERWGEGCHNAALLWRELQGQGFTGSVNMVQRHVAPWRRALPAGQRRGRAPFHLPRAPAPAPRSVLWLLLRPPERLSAEQAAFVARLQALCPAVRAAQELAGTFGRLVRERRAEGLDGWLAAAGRSGLAELSGFARSVGQDKAAVAAGLSSAWSNGQTEGQVNRLKTLKRQMYGRAGFALLRARVLASD